MPPSDALTLFLSTQSLLLAVLTVAVSVTRTKMAGEDLTPARRLAKWCFWISIVLAVGGACAWLDVYARCATAPNNVVEVGQAASIAIALVALPALAYAVKRLTG